MNSWLPLLLLILGTSACGRFSPSVYKLPEVQGPFFEAGGSDLQPSTDRMDSTCRTSRVYDTCLFNKNPVAQAGQSVSSSQLEDLRWYGVKIRDLAPSGFLENSHLQILALNTPRFTLQQRNLLKIPYSESRSYAEQLSAYYWANRVFAYLEPRMSGRFLPLSLKIYVDDVFTGYVSASESIHLEKTGSKIPAAFSADIVTHLIGHALANALSQKKVFSGDRSAQHKSCDLNPLGCCTTQLGCSQALAQSFGDYLVGMMNPTLPRIGETAGASPAGQPICGFARDLVGLSARTAVQAFSACSSAGANGRVSLMGAWYASLWWKLRSLEEQKSVGSGRDIDILFFDHAKSWTGTSTFIDVRAAALKLAQSFRGGRYATDFETIFTVVSQ